jgi:acyl-CoA synthetase (AMP-forming)/AMP-acid ligase II
MSSAFKRLSSLAAHFSPSSSSPTVPSAPDSSASGTDSFNHRHHIHQLSPTVFLPRAAAIEPEACFLYHVTANKQILRRSYQEAADRARGLAYFLLKHEYRRVGILAPNTPAFLESIYGIGAAGAVQVAINYRLKEEDIEYIFDHAEVDSIIVDAEFEHLLGSFCKSHPTVAVIVDTDTEATEGASCGPFDQAVNEGLSFDRQTGGHGWNTLETECVNEEGMIALSYTSGTTAKPKGVVYTHRGAYLATMGNIVESSLNTHNSKADRCHYLWTLPLFHACGWTFPWAVTAVRGTHYCLRKIDYPEIWRLLKDEAISHFNAAPTVNILLCADPNAEKLSGMYDVCASRWCCFLTYPQSRSALPWRRAHQPLTCSKRWRTSTSTPYTYTA